MSTSLSRIEPVPIATSVTPISAGSLPSIRLPETLPPMHALGHLTREAESPDFGHRASFWLGEQVLDGATDDLEKPRSGWFVEQVEPERVVCRRDDLSLGIPPWVFAIRRHTAAAFHSGCEQFDPAREFANLLKKPGVLRSLARIAGQDLTGDNRQLLGDVGMAALELLGICPALDQVRLGELLARHLQVVELVACGERASSEQHVAGREIGLRLAGVRRAPGHRSRSVDARILFASFPRTERAVVSGEGLVLIRVNLDDDAGERHAARGVGSEVDGLDARLDRVSVDLQEFDRLVVLSLLLRVRIEQADDPLDGGIHVVVRAGQSLCGCVLVGSDAGAHRDLIPSLAAAGGRFNPFFDSDPRCVGSCADSTSRCHAGDFHAPG